MCSASEYHTHGQAIKLNELTKEMGVEKNVSTFKHLLGLMRCNPPAEDCLMNACAQCPEEDVLQETLQDALECNVTDAITCNQWLRTNRCKLDTVTSTSDEFVENSISSLKKLKAHDLVVHQESSFLKETKSLLQEGEVIVLGGFSENYSFTIQHAAQGFHWNNQHEPTFIPLLAILKISKSELETLCFVIISEGLYHDTVTVYTSQKDLTAFLKEKCSKYIKDTLFF
jgi:hypothetical protein